MSSAKRQGKKQVNGGENLGARNVRRVKAGRGCSMLSVEILQKLVKAKEAELQREQVENIDRQGERFKNVLE